MATRFYLVPKAGSGQTIDDVYRPKYFMNGLGQGQVAGAIQAMDYGLEPVFLVAADVTNAEHTAAVANSDVTAFPVNLDAAIGVNLATVTGKIDALGLPSEWVDATTTYRQILRKLTQFIQFAQRLHGVANVRLLPVGVTLNSTVGSLSAAQRQHLRDAILTFANGTDSEITANMTLRVAIQALAAQIPFVATLLDVTL